MRSALVLRPPAKINLTLRVGPRRPDGFHDIRSLIQSIALSDTLSVTGRNGPLALHVRGRHLVPAVGKDRDLLRRLDRVVGGEDRRRRSDRVAQAHGDERLRADARREDGVVDVAQRAMRSFLELGVHREERDELGVGRVERDVHASLDVAEEGNVGVAEPDVLGSERSRRERERAG